MAAQSGRWLTCPKEGSNSGVIAHVWQLLTSLDNDELPNGPDGARLLAFSLERSAARRQLFGHQGGLRCDRPAFRKVRSKAKAGGNRVVAKHLYGVQRVLTEISTYEFELLQNVVRHGNDMTTDLVGMEDV